VTESFFDETASYVRHTLRLTGNEDVLEVGANAGLLLAKIKPYARTVTASDISLEALAKIVDPDIRTLVAEAIQQPFPDASFDVVICQGVYQLFPDLHYTELATLELVRVVKPGGRVLLGMLCHEWLEEDRLKADGRIARDVIAAWKNAIHLTLTLGKRLFQQPKFEQPLHRLSIDPAFFMQMGRKMNCRVMFPLQVTERREYVAIMKYRYSVLIEKSHDW
jgi:SAM-dependent methyltransferase